MGTCVSPQKGAVQPLFLHLVLPPIDCYLHAESRSLQVSSTLTSLFSFTLVLKSQSLVCGSDSLPSRLMSLA